ncbi:CDP-alcohol phosphatidyltransferase family protein [Flagellimonas zhangzhouensis]|uniref:CDP-diacylglycerol---serine O-phosphatidyltransferase n=1 Tax=Flagellimonas zhangzhouensis TaxID=1073328 RepID=A0A1H2R358_9FLAO|nr:CDP-alcohol phosphatidyltransferase family protein [Allomuricauda zhangzhouensis]SDQ58698.1 CDP-diacylglycerol---serine O-phosphatidyltransferase [Allomuricauda zhangzhouensis]SDW13129.1 CDP-diacylglycerol---serine O-phosphatidyltransferase [Allomuricauda zhangzhouensis]
MKAYIPNFLTLLNVLSGCIATVFAVLNHLEWAALFVFIGIFFDFFDGLAARALHVQSEIGLQLDSLADVITSGLVPGVVMFQLLSMAERGGWNLGFIGHDNDLTVLPFFGFIITLGSAYRLAKFNVDENQVASFRGLPTPANALLILSLPMILLYHNNEILSSVILNQWFLVGLTILSAYLLNSNIELFALKFKNWSFKDNGIRYLFLIGSLVLLLTLRFLAIPCIIIAYILMSLIDAGKKTA